MALLDPALKGGACGEQTGQIFSLFIKPSIMKEIKYAYC
jgi:hypothetical protein